MKKIDKEKAEAIATLREWIKPGDTVYTVLDHVSSSGMSRAIRVVLMSCDDGKVTDTHPNYSVGKALGLRHWKRNGREQDALVMGGCGMDMGFALVYELSHALFGGKRCDCPRIPETDKVADPSCPKCSGTGYLHDSGYVCTGEHCPSNTHVNSPRAPRDGSTRHFDGYALKHRWI